MLFTWCTVGGDDLDLAARVTAALDAWFAVVPCAELTHTYVGACDDATPVDLRVVAGDPDDVLPDGAVLVTSTDGTTTTITLNDTPFSSDAEVAAGYCVDTFNLDLLLAHALGDWLGLPHTCDEGEACADPAAQTAVMYWAIGPCDLRSLNAADEALMWDAYGDAPGCGGDTGALGDTAEDGDTGDIWPDGVTPMPDEDDDAETRGCATTGAPATGWGLLLALATAARRRR